MARFSLSARIRSFRYAGRGIAVVVRTQHNAWVHALATVAVVACGALLGLSPTEWQILVLAIALVWALEAVNTAIEALCDLVTTDPHPQIAKAKDVAAGAVLIAAAGAAIVGLSVLGPKLLALFH